MTVHLDNGHYNHPSQTLQNSTTWLPPRADDCAPLEHWVAVLLIVDVDPNPFRFHQLSDQLLKAAGVVFDGEHLQVGVDDDHSGEKSVKEFLDFEEPHLR